MLGIALIYFIGKYFYTLAEKHGKQKWGFAILGIIVYYAGVFLGGFLIGLGAGLGYYDIYDTPDIILGLMTIPFGILSIVILYQVLKRNWAGLTGELEEHEILDEDLL